jgi:hypothetical protein
VPDELRTRKLNASASQRVEELLRSLADSHGVVLHPYACEPWVIHPFSLTPTVNWIQGERVSWWARCVWCALGVAVLVAARFLSTRDTVRKQNRW